MHYMMPFLQMSKLELREVGKPARITQLTPETKFMPQAACCLLRPECYFSFPSAAPVPLTLA